MRSIIRYLLMSVLAFSVMYFSTWGIGMLQQQAKRTYNFSQYLYSVNLFYVVVGLALGLEMYFKEKGKPGKWNVNVWKLVWFGLPALFLTLGSLPPFVNALRLYQIAPQLGNMGLLIIVSEILLGYIVITSFYKVDNDMPGHKNK